LRLKICQGFDQYANVRPTRILPGIDGPLKRCKTEDLDWVIRLRAGPLARVDATDRPGRFSGRLGRAQAAHAESRSES